MISISRTWLYLGAAALFVGGFWLWQNRTALSLAYHNQALLGGAGNVAAGLSGLGVLS